MNRLQRENISKEIQSKFKILVLQALSLKGYQVKSENLHNFINDNCSTEEENGVTYYLVNNERFLSFEPSVELDFDIGRGAVFVINFGDFRYIR